jgi:RNA polymerase sigma-70 factor (ECF subfamily)
MDHVFQNGDRIMTNDDQTIVKAVQAGDREAFSVLVNRHKDRVYGVLMRLSADPQLAEELAHEAFVRAYRALDSFRGQARFGTWLVQIAVNLARDHFRARRRVDVVSLDALLERDTDAAVLEDTRPQTDPLSEISEREMRRDFERALQELPPAYREVFVLHHLQNIPYDEIQKITGDSIGSLKVRAHRARRILKDKLFPDARRMSPEDVVE